MAQKRDMAPIDPGAPAHADLQWLEFMAYSQGCCCQLGAGEPLAEAAPDLEPPLAGEAGVLH